MAIELIKINSPEAAADFVANNLNKQLAAANNLLWLVPGGSGLEVAAAAAGKITNSPHLSVSLTDERYGPVGHQNSNWPGLIEKGVIRGQAHFYPVLDGSPLDETAKRYSKMLNRLLGEADYSIALAGLGADGHIFGIKPGSPAIDSDDDVIGYHWEDFDRLTPTLRLLKKLDEVIIYAAGSEKYHQIKSLAKDIPADIQPAQMLKQLKKVIILNDHIGGTL